MALDANALKNRATQLARGFTPGQLAIAGALVVIGGVALLWFWSWASTPTYTVLFSDLAPSDAAQVVDQLDRDGVAHRLSRDGTTIQVPADKVHEVRLSMSSAGLPAGGVVGYELLDKQGLTTSDFKQRVDYQRALEGELTRTLLSIDGVDSASVHLAIPEDTLFSDNEEATRASVLLKTSGAIGDETVQSIAHLVASSVPGLQPEDVTIADVNGRVMSSPGLGGSAASDRQIRLTRDYEATLAADATSMLAQVYGAGHAVVRVSADLNFDESERETETYDPASQVALRENTETETYNGEGTPPAGILGVDGQPLETTDSGASTYDRQSDSREFGVDRVVERSRVAPGQVERLSVAVVLDEGADPAPDANRVQGIVAAALGIDTDRGDTIVVDTVAFDTSLDEVAAEAEASAAAAQSQDQMLGYARTGVGALVLLVALFLLFKGLRNTTVEAVAVGDDGAATLAAALAAAGAGGNGALSGAPGALGAGARGLPAGTVPAGALAGSDTQVLDLIDQQPDEVAVLLRGWLADRRA